MELLLGVVLGVIVTFLALYLTKKLRMAEEKQTRELHRDAQNEILLQAVADQMRVLQDTVHQPRNCSQYIHSSDYPVPILYLSHTGLGTDIKTACEDYPNIPSSYFI